MNGLRDMLLLAALLASSAAAPLSRIGGIDGMGNVYDVQTIGNIAYVASGNTGLMIFDVSNASLPKLLGSSVDCIGCNTTAQYVTVVGTTAYVVPAESPYQFPGAIHTVFAIVDVSTPSSPRQLGTYETDHAFYNYPIFVSGNYVYSRQNDVHVVDVSTPSSPSLVTKLDSERKWNAYCVAGTTLFAYSQAGVLQLYDVTIPSLPQTLGKLTVQGGTSSYTALSVFGSHLYVASGTFIIIIDISSRSAPKQMGTFTLTRFLALSVSGNTAYVGTYNDDGPGLIVVDISDPSTPVPVGSSAFTSVSTLSVSGTKVFAGFDTLVVFDVSNPSSPQPVGGYSTRDIMIGVELFGSMAVVTTTTQVQSNLTSSPPHFKASISSLTSILVLLFQMRGFT